MFEQILVAASGIGGIGLLAAERAELRRWGGLVGLVGQPFWLISTFQAQAWGQFAVSFIVTALYLKASVLSLRQFVKKEVL